MSNTAQQREVFMEVQVLLTGFGRVKKKISFRNSSNNISNSDFHSRIYKLSMTILQFNNKRLFDWNIAPNYKICTVFFHVILIGFNVNNLTKNNSFVVVTNKKITL